MNSINPYDYVSLNGHGTLRGVTLELPTESVRNLLPYGLELGDQDVTRPGTHPVVASFNDMLRAHMSIPTPLPSLTYHEYTLGIPFAYLRSGAFAGRSAGPFYFMPRLYLDNFLATLGGMLYWGFPKQMASFTVTDDLYAVAGSRGTQVTSLRFRAKGELESLDAFEAFEPVRRMLSQPVVSMLPIGMGPFFVCSNFDKLWREATVRPLETVMEINEAFVPDLTLGSFTGKGIDQGTLGSYELRAPWRMSMPYPPFAAGMF